MAGIHHVTAISGKAAHNLEFYRGVVGLRFVKKTVNFDDPSTYHLYYGDRVGHPGTILTFFPWEHAAAGRGGTGFTQQTSFRIPASAIGYWTHRFVEKGVAHEAPEKRFGEPVLSFTDPAGMSLALVGVAGAETEPAWDSGDVPLEHAIRGFHGVTLLLDDGARTAAVLRDVLGFSEFDRDGSLSRFRTTEAIGGHVDIREAKGFLRGRLGRGSVHHIAFRAADDSSQTEMARKLVADHGLRPTPQVDREYFRSVYFREPGGILFEIATDAPGFTVDEAIDSLGRDLKLPPFLEARRKEIEAVLPQLDTAEQTI
ncbi:MAG: ring-cleaving dioxygenase [Xanthobacteraceae bacterium]|jgi:glyoxalase family protein